MKKYIEDFSEHLSEALKIGESKVFSGSSKTFNNVCISGLGGSGIGGTIVSQLIADKCSIPVIVNKDYSIPEFVDSTTLFIACSYSGNTEETLEALALAEKKGAEIACITSGGDIKKIAENKSYNHLVLPEGFPPRAAFGYSLPQILFILTKYNIVNWDFTTEINEAIALLNDKEQEIQQEAKEIANQLNGSIPVIYATAPYEGVAVRFRQQINENSKMLCWHHSVPEMNHNELVGWAGGNPNMKVVIFRNEDDYYRSQKRIEINKEIYSKYTNTIIEVHSKGSTRLVRSLYLIHLGDWVSQFLAELKQIDPVEVDVISFLKGELAKI